MRIIFILVLSLLFSSLKNLCSQKTHLHGQISKILKYDTEINFDQTPAFLVGVLDRDVFSIESFGYSNVQSPLTMESCFELGALSKALTFLIVKSLVNKGVLQINSPINSYLPSEYQNPRLDYITINDLIYYTSGLPNSLVGMGYKQTDLSSPYGQYTKADILTFFRNYVKRDALSADHYMDLDYALLGIIIEFATNDDFQSNLDLEVNKVLGSNFFVTKYEMKENLVVEGMSMSGIWSPGSKYNAFESALGIKGSLSDLEKFLRYVISDSVNSEFHNLKNNKPSNAWDKGVLAKDGLYLIEVNRGQKVFASYGHTNIHQVFLGFKENTKTGVVVLANSSTGTKDLGMLVLKMVNENWKRKN